MSASLCIHSTLRAVCSPCFNWTNSGTVSAATSETLAYRDEDEVMEDAVTSNPGKIPAILSLFWSIQLQRVPLGDVTLTIELCIAPNVIDLPDDDEEPERPSTRKNRQAPASGALHTTPRAEPVVQDTGDVNRGSVTFAEPLSSALPSSSTAQAPVDPPSVFATHHVPEDEVNAAKEAIRQAGIMMEKMKTVRYASQAAYNASSAL